MIHVLKLSTAGCLLVTALAATAQIIQVGPPGTPPVFIQGTTSAAAVRNAVQATADQCKYTAQIAAGMAQRAYTANYGMENAAVDFQNLQSQFQNLRSTFQIAATMAQQLQSSRAANAVAELDAGLNIISEAFAPLQQELQAGAVNRETVASLGRVMNEALKFWDRELKKKSARLGMIR